MGFQELNYDLKQLRSLIEVVRQGSFTKAARSLNMGQGTVSHQISSLEDMLGVVLIQRNTRSMNITPAGELFLKHAKTVLAMASDLTSELKSNDQGYVTRIAASTIPSTYLLPPVLSKLLAQNPTYRYLLDSMDSREAIESVKEGNAEIAIVGQILKHPSLRYVSIAEDEVMLAGTSPFPEVITKEELEQIPVIAREFGSGTRRAFEEALGTLGISPSRINTVFQCNTSECVREAAVAGLGVAYLSKYVVDREIENKTLHAIKIPGVTMKRKFLAVTSNKNELSLPAGKLLRAMQEYYESS